MIKTILNIKPIQDLEQATAKELDLEDKPMSDIIKEEDEPKNNKEGSQESGTDL